MSSFVEGMPAPGSPEKKRTRSPEAPRVDAFPPGGLGEVERVGRRPVERRGPDLPGPLDGGQRLALHPRPEREHGRAQALAALESAPGAHVETEEGADQDPVAGAEAHAPHGPGVRLADPLPVVGAHPEHGRAARRPAGAVDAGHRLRGNAQVVAERRAQGLRGPQLLLGHDGEASEVRQASERLGGDSRRLPLLPVEGTARPGVADLLAELREDEAVARRGVRALDLGQPVLGIGRRTVCGIVARRPDGEVHAAGAPDRVEVEEAHERTAEGGPTARLSRPGSFPPARGPWPPAPRAAFPGGRPRPRRSRGARARPRPG